MHRKTNVFAQTRWERLAQWAMIAFIGIMVAFCVTVANAQDVDFYHHKGRNKHFRVKADKKEIRKARQARRMTFRLNDTLSIEMIENPIYADNFSVETRTHGKRAVNRGKHFYSKKRFASISITSDDEVTGSMGGLQISDNGVQPDSISKMPFEPEESPMLPIDAILLSDLIPVNADPTVQPGQWPISCKQARIYVEVTFPYFKACGSDVQKTTDVIAGAFAQVSAAYLREGIQLKMYKIKIWDVQDPYSTVSSLSLMLLNFANTEGPKTESKNYDIGSLIDLSTASRGFGGLSYVNGLNIPQAKFNAQCLYTSFSPLTTYSWTVGCWAHEIGHSFGSKHTHWCGWPGGRIDSCASGEVYNNVQCGTTQKARKGTIMSYCHITLGGIDLTLGFGPLPGAAIRDGLLKSNVPCVGIPVPICSSYTYSAWSACQNGKKTRTMISASPSGCQAIPLLDTVCTVPVQTFQDGIPGAVTMSVRNKESWFSIPIATDAADWLYEISYCSYDGKTPPDSMSKVKACSIRNLFNFTKPTADQLKAGKIELPANPQPFTKGLYYKVLVRYQKTKAGMIQTKNSGWSVW